MKASASAYNSTTMGQVALGFRSLAIRAAIFFVMAALLAWALGGALWAQTHRFEIGHGVAFMNGSLSWQMSIEPGENPEPWWTLMLTTAGNNPQPFSDAIWRDVAGPVVVHDRVYFAGRGNPNQFDGGWCIAWTERSGSLHCVPMPDRLAVEQQLQRIRAGLPLQDLETIARQRPLVLNPADEPH